MFNELTRLPQVDLDRTLGAVYLFACLFMLFMFFVTGGILESFKQDRKLTTGEFFAASGTFFWRFVRLALLSIVPFVVVWMSHQALSKGADKVDDRSIADQVGIFLNIRHGHLPFAALALGAAVVRHRAGSRRRTE